jgi:hypothetical protein
MFALTTRSEQALVKQWGCSCVKGMFYSNSAEGQKREREFEINCKLRGLHEELKQFNDLLQGKNGFGTQYYPRQIDFMSVGHSRQDFKGNGKNFSNSDMRFGLAAGVVLGLFFLYNRGGKDEKETQVTQ